MGDDDDSVTQAPKPSRSQEEEVEIDYLPNLSSDGSDSDEGDHEGKENTPSGNECDSPEVRQFTEEEKDKISQRWQQANAKQI